MDLDMSDVLADADRMFSDMLDRMVEDDEITLRINRYDYGPDARAGEPHSIAVVETCDYVLAHYRCFREFGPHDEHDDCERILADMNGGDDGSWYADALNREAEEGMLGRPLFPNEY